MKTLIESSIEIYGMGHPDIKHVFNITKEDERNDKNFKNLEKLIGRTLTFRYKYTESNITGDGRILLTISELSELEIKDFILKSINGIHKIKKEDF